MVSIRNQREIYIYKSNEDFEGPECWYCSEIWRLCVSWITYKLISEYNLQTAAVLLFESSLAQLRSNEDLEGPECSYYYYSSGCNISPLALYIYVSMHIFYIYDCVSVRGQKQELLAIFALSFTHRYTGTNKPRWQNVAFDLVI